MRRLFVRVWSDDGGSGLLTGEWLFMFAVLVLGLISGLVAMRQSLLSELAETADALLALNQSFDPCGQSNCESSTACSSVGQVTHTVAHASVGPSPSRINQAPCD